jgi:hypothetical protein
MTEKTEIDSEAQSPHKEAQSLLCPILTLADAMRPQVKKEGLDGVQCQGPACGFYLPFTDENGKVTGGGCSIRAGASFLSQTNVGLSQALMVLAKRAKLIG